MNYLEREKKAFEGIQLLKQGIFPNELIETIKESRLRADLTNDIFSPKGSPRFNDLSPDEKTERSRRLKVELAFVKYMAGFESMRYSSILLLLLGFLTIFYWTIYENDNLQFGIISSLEAALFFAISFKNETIIKFSQPIFMTFVVLLILELLIFWIPNPYLFPLDNEFLTRRTGAVGKLFNISSPFLYLLGKLTIAGSFTRAHFRIKKFQESKREYEENKWIQPRFRHIPK